MTDRGPTIFEVDGHKFVAILPKGPAQMGIHVVRKFFCLRCRVVTHQTISGMENAEKLSDIGRCTSIPKDMGRGHGDPGGYWTCPKHGLAQLVIRCEDCEKEYEEG